MIFETGTKNGYPLNNENKFKVRWKNNNYPMASTDSCGTACEVGYGNTCLSSTTPTNTQAYDITDVNIESTILNVLFIGAFSNLIQDSTMYTKCISTECQAIAGTTSSGIHAIWYKKTAEGSVGSMDIDTIFEIISTIAGNEHLFLYNRLSTVSVSKITKAKESVHSRIWKAL